MRKGGGIPAFRIAHAALSVNTFQHEKREENVEHHPERDKHGVEPCRHRSFDMEVETVNISGNIRRKREEAGVTQAELATKVGVTQSMLCQIERGTKACSMPLGAEIAHALGCDVADLFDDTDRPA